MAQGEMLKIYVEKKYVVAFRIVMVLVSLPFLDNVYEVLAQGYVDRGSYVVNRGEHWGYYTNVFKNGAFALFFLYLAVFGVRAKSEN